MKVNLTLPRATSPIIDENGKLTQEWFTFFHNLYVRVGGNSAQSDLIDDADGSLADATRAINEILDAMDLYNITTDD